MNSTQETQLAIPINEDGKSQVRSWGEAFALGEIISRSKFAPKGMERPEDIAVAIVAGKNVGLDPLASCQQIAVINGRPSLYGDAALAVVKGELGKRFTYKEEFFRDEASGIGCRVTVSRSGEQHVETFTEADAKRAGLWGKAGPWTQYPKRMLMFRARAFALRTIAPDVLAGISMADEQADIEVEIVEEPAEAKAALVLEEDAREGAKDSRGGAKGARGGAEGARGGAKGARGGAEGAREPETVETEVVDEAPDLTQASPLTQLAELRERDKVKVADVVRIAKTLGASGKATRLDHISPAVAELMVADWQAVLIQIKENS